MWGSDLAIRHQGGEIHAAKPLGRMARPLRLLVENGHYHVTSRTWDRSPLYRNDEDRHEFLDLLEANVERFDWRCLAYCLMDNHFHLLVRTPLANLPRGMQRINSRYAQLYNKWRGRKGPVYEGRYHGPLIQRAAWSSSEVRCKAYLVIRRSLVAIGPRVGRRWQNYSGAARQVRRCRAPIDTMATQ
jgi:putative transposase